MHFRAIFVLLIVCLQAVVWGQEFSDRQQIAVFRLSYYGQPIIDPPPGLKIEVRGRRGSFALELRGSGNPQVDNLFARALGAVDEKIRSTFVNLGRFEILGMDQRLTSGSVNEFITVLTEFKRSQTELPEAVLLGQQAFTEADFRELVGGFVVVVPSVSWYSLTQNDDGSYRAEVETSFTFVNVENLATFAQFFITTSATSDDREAAVRSATEEISGELSFRIRSMPEFQIKTGILEVNGREVIFEFGRDMGLQPGDEYSIVSNRVLESGHIAATETGLVMVTEVQQGFSVGTVVYANPTAMVGDQLQEVARRGVEISPYLDLITNGLSSITYAIGARAIVSRGFYPWRPLAAVEIPLRSLLVGTLPGSSFALLPVNLMVGGEWNAQFGRLRLSPSVAVGAGGALLLSSDEEMEVFYLSHLGGQIRATGSVQITRDLTIFVEAGFAVWQSVYNNSIASLVSPLSSYGGLLVGGGVTLK